MTEQGGTNNGGRSRAFGRRSTSADRISNDAGSISSSGGRIDTSQAIGSISTSRNDTNDSTIVTTNTSDSITVPNVVGGNGISEIGSGGISGSAESARERRNRLRREKYAAERLADGYSVQSRTDNEDDREQDDGGASEDPIEEAESTRFTISVENPIVDAPENVPKTAPRNITPARPRSSRGGAKYKEPNKDAVNLMASSMQDIYSVTDSIIGFVAAMTGKSYVEGTMLLADQKAEKMAFSLAQMNRSMPKLAEQINKYSAPATFASVFLTDLAIKGAMIFAAFRQPSNEQSTPPS